MSFIYSQASKVLKSIITKKSGLKTACFAHKVNVKSVYAIIQKVLPNYRKLEKEIKKISTPNKYLAVVMLYDFWSSGKISGGGSLKKLIQSSFPVAKSLITSKNKSIWVRLNGFKPVKDPEKIQELKQKDDLIENLYFAERSKRINQMIQEFELISQSKASCMPVEALKLRKGDWNAIDTCAAPGNKTLQLAEKMKKFTTGVLFAYEKDPKRFDLLKSRIKAAGAENIIPINSDFFEAKLNRSNVKLAIVDPSCSGSGIIEHQIADYGKIHNDFEYCDPRIQSLSNFQTEILSKVLRIRGIQQVVYSTCSVYMEENEKVVEKTMERYWRRFRLGKVLDGWKDRGIGEYGKVMARCVPKDTNSQGFFIAKMLKRSLRLRHKILRRSKRYWTLKKQPNFL